MNPPIQADDGLKLKKKIINEMLASFRQSLEMWYPLCLDKESGGYFTNISCDWKLLPEQEKMIVTQARHVWTLSKAARFFDEPAYTGYAKHGFEFLKNKMWDNEYGGFYQVTDRQGNVFDFQNFFDEKRTYGNAFAVYGIAALYDLTKDNNVLETAKKGFEWIEKIAADPEEKGYFQFLTRKGELIDKDSDYKTKAADAVEAGYKDQNSSIHLLEAYTELYNIWKDDKVAGRLRELLFLIRDTITTEKGHMNLFFDRKWNPVSFRDASEEVRKQNYGLDHVSFGHDYETAFLLLEASHTLGIENDTATLFKAKKMLDHAIENGWDNSSAGFFDEGYYFDENGKCEIIKDTKVWWAQAEGMNSLLLFSKIFPDEKRYYELFLKQWNYIKEYLLDKEHGDWYWGSLEKEPFYKTEPKSNIWKGTYHIARTLMNCIKMLTNGNLNVLHNEGFKKEKEEFDNFIEHWRNVAEN